MNQKDLRKLAKQIAKLESHLQDEEITDEDRARTEGEIEHLCLRVTSFSELDQLDEMIQDFLKKN